MHALVTRMTNLSLRQQLMGLAILAIVVMPMALAFATPEAPDSASLVSSAGTAMNDWNLGSYLIAFAIAGIAIFVARGIRRLVR